MPTGDLDGLSAMLAELGAIEARVKQATRDGIGDALHELEAEIKQNLSLTSHPAGTPTPSPPGSPPSLVTGHLRRSVMVIGPVEAGGEWTGSVAPTAVYARIQELGGTAGRGSHLPARPYVAPAVAAVEARLDAIIERRWLQAFS